MWYHDSTSDWIIWQRFSCCAEFIAANIKIYLHFPQCSSLNHSRTRMFLALTHWGRVTHICVGKLTIIDSDNGLSPGRHQAIIWTNAGILLIGPLGTNFNEILIGIQTFSFKKMHLKMSSAKWHPFCVGLNVLMNIHHVQYTYSSCIICYDIPVMWVAYKAWQAVRRLGHNEWRYNYLMVIQIMHINMVSWQYIWLDYMAEI